MNPDIAGKIVPYIEQQRGTYTREAITAQLLAAGYPAADVETAWVLLEGQIASGTMAPGPPPTGGPGAPRPRGPRLSNQPAFWGTLLGFILVSYGLPGLLLWLAAGAGADANLLSSAALILFLGLAVGAMIGGLVWRDRKYAVSRGLLIGLLMVVVVLPLVGGLVIAGICVYSLTHV